MSMSRERRGGALGADNYYLVAPHNRIFCCIWMCLSPPAQSRTQLLASQTILWLLVFQSF